MQQGRILKQGRLLTKSNSRRALTREEAPNETRALNRILMVVQLKILKTSDCLVVRLSQSTIIQLL